MTSPRERPLVLVVDDDEAGLFVKSEMVRRAGFSVVEAATGKRALDVAHSQPIDIVLLDVNLPDMSGIEVCARIKSDRALSTVQVLQISSTAVSVADRVRGLENGADAYLTEPGPPEVVAATLQALMRVRRAELDLAAAVERETEARELAERANRVKDDFLATLSHELRTPLNAMLGWISQLNRNTVDEAGRTRALAALERSARLQWRLVNELLDSASIAQGSLRVEKAPVDLQNVALAAIESVRSEADRREIQIVLEAQSVRVIGDATRLQQVITNLINNAVQFTPAGGRVLVTIETSDDDAVIAVQDTGIGIEADFLPHVFDRFKQGPGGSRDGHSGLGLGLAIARHIVELHGGTIVAESAGVGRGAVFTIHLPLSDRRAPAAPAGRNASADV